MIVGDDNDPYRLAEEVKSWADLNRTFCGQNSGTGESISCIAELVKAIADYCAIARLGSETIW